MTKTIPSRGKWAESCSALVLMSSLSAEGFFWLTWFPGAVISTDQWELKKGPDCTSREFLLKTLIPLNISPNSSHAIWIWTHCFAFNHLSCSPKLLGFSLLSPAFCPFLCFTLFFSSSDSSECDQCWAEVKCFQCLPHHISVTCSRITALFSSHSHYWPMSVRSIC